MTSVGNHEIRDFRPFTLGIAGMQHSLCLWMNNGATLHTMSCIYRSICHICASIHVYSSNQRLIGTKFFLGSPAFIENTRFSGICTITTIIVFHPL